MDELADAAARLRRVIRLLSRRAENLTAENGPTVQQHAVLGWLSDRAPLTTKTLADLERVRPQSMAHVVDALAERGWIRRVPDATDRRQVLLSLTDLGVQVLASGRELRQAWLVEAIRSRLSAQERTRLVAAIELLERIGSGD